MVPRFTRACARASNETILQAFHWIRFDIYCWTHSTFSRDRICHHPQSRQHFMRARKANIIDSITSTTHFAFIVSALYCLLLRFWMRLRGCLSHDVRRTCTHAYEVHCHSMHTSVEIQFRYKYFSFLHFERFIFVAVADLVVIVLVVVVTECILSFVYMHRKGAFSPWRTFGVRQKNTSVRERERE